MPDPSQWGEEAHVAEYLGRMDRLAARAAGEDALRDVLPRAPRRVLDLACGDGRLAALVLEARDTVDAVVAVDSSPPMLERATARFAADPRVIVEPRDLDDPIEDLGEFDVVVSGFAIHHLEDARKRSLFGELATMLTPGGIFANLEVVASPTPELHATFLAAIGRTADDPGDRLVSVDTQLAWMRDAGLTQVDCLWKWRGFALLVGGAPEPLVDKG